MKKEQMLNLTLAVLAVCLLTSCGSKKSPDVIDSASVILNTPFTLANCNRSVSASLALNLSTVTETTTGQINPDWLKVKFNFLSVDVTQTGNNIKFFKWRVIGTTAQLDPTPLEFNAYTLSNGQTTSETMSGVLASQVSQQYGFYLRLNDDPQYPYQVLKVVVYKSDGSILTQSDLLIPQFTASPVDYKLNTDGSTRAENLLKLHPLYTTDVTAWTPAQLKQNFDQYCF